MAWVSKLGRIAAEVEVKSELAAGASARIIEQGAKQRVPVSTGRLRDAIHIEHDKGGDFMVIAGNKDAFYGHIVEHGGVRTTAHPFLIPALEDNLHEIEVAVIAVGKTLEP